MKTSKLKTLPLLLLIIPILLFSCSNNDQDKRSETESTAKAQPQSPDTQPEYEVQKGDTIWNLADQMPEFKGGDGELLKYIVSNIKYPEAAKESGKEGRVIIRFCVDKEGNVVDPGIVRGVEPDLDKEALRVINTIPAFEKPATKKGRPVSVWYVVPINFALKN